MSDDDDVPADDDEMEWCGSCSQEASGLVHSCLLKRYEPGHNMPVHSWVLCKAVVMPVNGYYFCNLHCLRAYNGHVALLGAHTDMPDEGPGNETDDRFLLPVRRRPGVVNDVDEDEDPVWPWRALAYHSAPF